MLLAGLYIGYRAGRSTLVLREGAMVSTFDPGPGDEPEGDYIGDELMDYDDPSERGPTIIIGG